MSCGLSKECLFILNLLYSNRNFKPSAGYHSEKLKKIYIKKFPHRDDLSLDEAIRILITGGYIGITKKKEPKYYISKIDISFYALDSHGFTVVSGKFRKL